MGQNEMKSLGRRATLVLLGIGVATAVASPAQAQPPAPVVVFGDSLSVGTASGLTSDGYKIRNLGIVGWGMTKPDVANRLSELREAAKTAAAVVVLVGANDRRNIGKATLGTQAWKVSYGNWLAAVRQAVPASTPVIWITQPDYRDPQLDCSWSGRKRRPHKSRPISEMSW